MPRRTRGNAPERTAAVVGPITREPPPIRNSAAGLPLFYLHGGPYDGLDVADDPPIHSVLYFPHEIHVSGDDGFARYTITGEDQAEFIPEEPD